MTAPRTQAIVWSETSQTSCYLYHLHLCKQHMCCVELRIKILQFDYFFSRLCGRTCRSSKIKMYTIIKENKRKEKLVHYQADGWALISHLSQQADGWALLVCKSFSADDWTWQQAGRTRWQGDQPQENIKFIGMWNKSRCVADDWAHTHHGKLCYLIVRWRNIRRRRN